MVDQEAVSERLAPALAEPLRFEPVTASTTSRARTLVLYLDDHGNERWRGEVAGGHNLVRHAFPRTLASAFA